MKKFSGKVVVVTGAASGLGRALALACGARQMKVVLADVSAARLAEIEALANATLAKFGAAHLLFNNTGVAISAPL